MPSWWPIYFSVFFLPSLWLFLDLSVTQVAFSWHFERFPWLQEWVWHAGKAWEFTIPCSKFLFVSGLSYYLLDGVFSLSSCTVPLSQADLLPLCRYFTKLTAKNDFWFQSRIWSHSDSVFVHWINKYFAWFLILSWHLEMSGMQKMECLKVGFINLILTLFWNSKMYGIWLKYAFFHFT